MIDVVFVACNRLEFTRASLTSLRANTDWSRARLIVYDDGSVDGTAEWLEGQGVEVRKTALGSPVSVMLDYLRNPSEVWAKIDNDTMVPPGWLDECERVMSAYPELELLGIEAMGAVGDGQRSYRPAEFIGGIGLFRSCAWRGRPAMQPQGRFGFTAWQSQNGVRAGWLTPALPVCLLDCVPLEPWSSLTAEYVRRGWARAWEPYTAERSYLWEWWRQ